MIFWTFFLEIFLFLKFLLIGPIPFLSPLTHLGRREPRTKGNNRRSRYLQEPSTAHVALESFSCHPGLLPLSATPSDWGHTSPCGSVGILNLNGLLLLSLWSCTWRGNSTSSLSTVVISGMTSSPPLTVLIKGEMCGSSNTGCQGHSTLSS